MFGPARNERLQAAIAPELVQARAAAERCGEPAQRFKDFACSTRDSWSGVRRVIGKAEWTQIAANPRFVATSLTARKMDGRKLYEVIYCARGEMEYGIKECQLDLFGERLIRSAAQLAATMAANQLRLRFAGFACVLLCGLRRIGLAFTQFAHATCGTIRRALVKIGALVSISARRVVVPTASVCPLRDGSALAHALLRREAARVGPTQTPQGASPPSTSPSHAAQGTRGPIQPRATHHLSNRRTYRRVPPKPRLS